MKLFDGQRRVEDRELDLNRAAIGVEVHLRRHRRNAEMRRRIGLQRQPRRRRPDLQRHVARGIELLQQRRRADADRPVLVRQRASQDRLRRGRAVLDERAERRRARDIRQVALPRLVRRGQRRPRRPAASSSPRPAAAATRTAGSSAFNRSISTVGDVRGREA